MKLLHWSFMNHRSILQATKKQSWTHQVSKARGLSRRNRHPLSQGESHYRLLQIEGKIGKSGNTFWLLNTDKGGRLKKLWLENLECAYHDRYLRHPDWKAGSRDVRWGFRMTVRRSESFARRNFRGCRFCFAARELPSVPKPGRSRISSRGQL